MLWIKEREEAKVCKAIVVMMNRFAKCKETDKMVIGFEKAMNLNNICYRNLHVQYDLHSGP